MSKSIIKIRRKSDDKILFDVINDSCQVHNIYDDGKLIGSFKEWEIDYMDNDFLKDSPYEEIESITENEWNAMADAYEKSIYKELGEYNMKPKYIKDAIIWNRRAAKNGAWVRVSDINYIESEDVFTPALHYGLGRFIIRQAYPYEDWMEEYIGTNKKLTDDERFKCNYKF